MSTKTLLLLRHAKSSWDQPELDDHERPLNARGRKAATRMGRLLREQAFNIDLVICSTSVRTRETAKLFFGEGSNIPTIHDSDDLYHVSAVEIAHILKQVGDPTLCLMLIGHNPGFEEFVEQVVGSTIHFPTAALAWIELKIDRWSSFCEQTRGDLKQMWRPRDLD